MPATISEAEKARVDRAIRAAVSASWNEFANLADAPFSNDASMKEQFEDSSRRLQETGGGWKVSSEVGIVSDGTRLITTRIEAPPAVDIVLTLHSTTDRNDSTISIWTFHQQLNWDD
ncbi:hypothetical protein EOD23_15595 [Mesorhizobium sp. USDA-HM6]|nr:hypothetical protein EOD23_15595 [Mesorhizobium sp. USDA-HM6]